jgi:HEAT repeat protein
MKTPKHKANLIDYMMRLLIRSAGAFVFACLLAFSVFPQASQIKTNYSERIEFGTDEIKRDTLQSLARLRSADASRIAAAGLNDPSELVRATAISAVLYLPPDELNVLLAPLLQDRSSFIRKEAVSGLGFARISKSAPSLILLLNRDKNPEVRAAAAVALGRIGNPAGLPALVGILKIKPKSSKRFLRRSAARSIGQIAVPQTGVGRFQTTPENFLPAKHKTTKLMNIGSSAAAFADAVQVLKKMLRDKRESNGAKREAAFALGNIGDDSSKTILQDLSRSEDYYLAEICREALLKIAQE